MKQLFCLMGPTASGKTELAVVLVKRFPMEIVNVDSAQVYRGMDIGTAKPDASILEIAPHHLINLRDPAEIYSVAQFCEDAVKVIGEIVARGNIPLLTGGTMLYFRALQKGLSELPSANAKIREEIIRKAEKIGWEAMHAELVCSDPVSAAKIHPADTQRIQRALEVTQLSGQALSAHHGKQKSRLSGFAVHNIAIAPADRAILHQKIAMRFQKMLAMGLIDEVKKLYDRHDLAVNLPALRAAGYREVMAYLSGKLTVDEMEKHAVIATRQLAKRQLTWLRHWPGVIWFDSEKNDLFERVSEHIDCILKQSGE